MSDDGYDDYLDRDDDDGFDPDGDEPEFDDYGTEGNLALAVDEAREPQLIGVLVDSIIRDMLAAHREREPDSNVLLMLRPAVEPPTNDPDQELCFHVCLGQPPARQKSIVLKLYAHGKIGPETAEIVLNALGLGAA